MTYLAGSPIKATDYNDFATSPGGIKQIYSDTSPGSVPTVLGTFNSNDPCTFGYGQQSTLSLVSPNDAIKASQWAELFSSMRSAGTHQGTVVVPPVPATNPVPGDKIIAQNSITPLSSAVNLLKANRFNVAPGQTSLTTGTHYSSSTHWGSSLVFTCKINFGSWDNARYFFNSGGNFSVNASYVAANPSSPTPEEISWSLALNNLSGTIVNYKDALNVLGYTKPNRGFYGLTNQWQQLYSRTSGGSGGYYYYYSSNLTVIGAKFESAGTSGVVNLSIELLDNDSFITQKYGTTSCWINFVRSAGAVTISAPTITNVQFTTS